MKNILTPLAKSVLSPLGLTTAASATAFQKETAGSRMTTLMISNEEMNDIMKIVNYFEESNFLIKDISETIENEAKETIGAFLGMFLDTLGATLSGNMLAVNELFELVNELFELVKARIFNAASSFN